MSASDAASGWKNESARSFVLTVTTAGIVATRDPQDGHRLGGWPSRRRRVLRDVRAVDHNVHKNDGPRRHRANRQRPWWPRVRPTRTTAESLPPTMAGATERAERRGLDDDHLQISGHAPARASSPCVVWLALHALCPDLTGYM